LIKIPSALIVLLFISEILQIFQIFAIAGYGFALVDLIILLIFTSAFYQFVFQKKKFALPDKKVFWSIAGLLFASIFSLIGLLSWGAGSDAIIQYFKTFAHFTFVVSIAFVALSTDISIESLYSAIKSLLIISIFVNIYAIYQLFARMFGLPGGYLEITNVGFLNRDYGTEVGEMKQIVLTFENFYRATSIYSEPSSLALFNVWIILFVLIPSFAKTKKFIQNEKWNIFIGILAIITLFLTFSMTGLAMISAIVIFLIIVAKIQIKKYLIPVLMGAIVLTATDFILKDFTKVSILELFASRIEGIFTQNKGGGISGESAPQRIKTMKNGWMLFTKSPIFGIGSGNTYHFPGSQARFADSSFFHVLSEMGMIGITFFFLMFLLAFQIGKQMWQMIEKMKIRNPKLATLQAVSYPLIILIIFQAMILANLIGIASFWIYFSIILITYRNTVKELESDTL